MKKIYIFTLLILATSSKSFCEYRVYQYYVRPKIQNIVVTGAELVTSTLGPIAYAAYHGGKESVEVSLLRSWQCMGNTSRKSVCTISDGKEISGAGQ